MTLCIFCHHQLNQEDMDWKEVHAPEAEFYVCRFCLQPCANKKSCNNMRHRHSPDKCARCEFDALTDRMRSGDFSRALGERQIAFDDLMSQATQDELRYDWSGRVCSAVVVTAAAFASGLLVLIEAVKR